MTYTVTVENKGAVAVKGLVITDAIKDITTEFADGSNAQAFASWTIDGVVSTEDLSTTINLDKDESKVFTIAGTLKPGAIGTVANTASYTYKTNAPVISNEVISVPADPATGDIKIKKQLIKQHMFQRILSHIL
ncbi:DUF11 domain-containing protein [Cetobacterium somerae]|uniref:DUF11 domain-containing protein n=1 Tax=Cetobacterium sp. NK01 TaxID=2993530 RepID=UPI002116CB63|nr:DUF11 domain-containing protein [Cetobacterium sp. NK01]MCQ8210980.1 DUF11 domain-containing protein [Cetobacterium sp. NK01]